MCVRCVPNVSLGFTMSNIGIRIGNPIAKSLYDYDPSKGMPPELVERYNDLYNQRRKANKQLLQEIEARQRTADKSEEYAEFVRNLGVSGNAAGAADSPTFGPQPEQAGAPSVPKINLAQVVLNEPYQGPQSASLSSSARSSSDSASETGSVVQLFKARADARIDVRKQIRLLERQSVREAHIGIVQSPPIDVKKMADAAFKARDEANKCFKPLDANSMAITLQAAFRGHSARKRVAELRLEKNFERAEQLVKKLKEQVQKRVEEERVAAKRLVAAITLVGIMAAVIVAAVVFGPSSPARKTLDEFDECFHNFAAVALSGFALSLTPFVAIAPPVYAAGTAVVSVFAAGFCS